MKIIAHRGASGSAPENTIAAMKLALKLGCDGIETDLQLTKDGRVVVFHDWSVERTTDGEGEIKDLTFEELSKLDNGSWFSDEFKGERIATLEELLDLVPENLVLNLELKSQAFDSRGLEEKVMEILNKKNRKKNIVISSFSHRSLERVRRLDKTIKLGILFEAYLIGLPEYIKNLDLDLWSVHPGVSHVDGELIDTIHKLDLLGYVWTVNDKKTAERLKEYGVDGIITNYPDLFK
nr:glycerophosphodiester phosphodiesterase [Tissierella sp.]